MRHTLPQRATRHALRDERRLALSYLDSGDKASERIVWPVALGVYSTTQMLAAWCELRIGSLRHPTRPQHQRFDLFLGEHQRRQHEAGLQDIAKAGFAIDRRALALQGHDVAIKRAHADAELVGERLPAHRLAVAAKDLQQFEQAFGARHEIIL